jgi:hypothetical protein
MKELYRASVVRRDYLGMGFSPIAREWSPDEWTIPVLFRNRDDAIAAACKAAKRKIERHGGEWSIDIWPERVFIL